MFFDLPAVIGIKLQRHFNDEKQTFVKAVLNWEGHYNILIVPCNTCRTVSVCEKEHFIQISQSFTQGVDKRCALVTVFIMNPASGDWSDVSLNVSKGMNENVHCGILTWWFSWKYFFVHKLKVWYYRNKNASEAHVTQYSA